MNRTGSPSSPIKLWCAAHDARAIDRIGSALPKAALAAAAARPDDEGAA